MSAERAQLEEGIAALGMKVSAAALERFDRYSRELLIWKNRLNLTAASTAPEIVGLHFIDSLLPLVAWKFPADCRLADIGSGAGFPGIPLKLLRPDLRLTLVEASRRRVAFLEHVRSAIDLEGVEILWARAELLAHRPEYRETFGAAVERATAHVGAAVELCLPFVAVGGAVILLKGPGAIKETEDAASLIVRLGGAVESCEARALPTTDRQRVTVVVRKIGPTPTGFPRRTSHIGHPMLT